MRLEVIGSSSNGNGYLLIGDEEVLIIEAGISFKKVQQKLNYNIGNVAGLIATHIHGDHFGKIDEYLSHGIKCFASNGTIDNYNFKGLSATTLLKKQKIGGFTIVTFDVIHDCPEPIGFYISHKEMGNLVFITDSMFVRYNFPNVNHWVVESNYAEQIVNDRLENGRINEFLYDRVRKSHMSVETCTKMLMANDLSKTKNIVLTHLSPDNSDENYMIDHVQSKTGINSIVAKPGVSIELGFNSF